MIRRRINTSITEGQRPRQDTIHRRVGGEYRARGLESLPQGGLQVARNGDDHGCGLASRQLVNQLELPVGPQGCL
jgi:hypothetical protein